MEKTKGKGQFGDGFIKFCNNCIPNSMTIAFLITILVVILALIICRVPIINSTDTKTSLLDAWTGGVWQYLELAMNSILLVLSGYIVANAPVSKKFLGRFASIPKSQGQAFFLMLTMAFVGFFIHWGIGMMAVIIVGREVLARSKEQGYKIHVPAFVAALYVGVNSIQGLTETIPMLGNSVGFFQSLVPESYAGAIQETYSLYYTSLNPSWIIMEILGFIIFGVVIWRMADKAVKNGSCELISDELYADVLGDRSAREKVIKAEAEQTKKTIAEKLELSVIIAFILGIWMAGSAISTIIEVGFLNIGYETFNLLLLGIGLILCGNTKTFVKCIEDGITATWGIAVQYPLYAGIYGLFVNTGLSTAIATGLMAVATKGSLPFITYFMNMILGIFIPATSAKAFVVLTNVLPAAIDLGVNINTVISSFTWGTAINSIHPFWALTYIMLFKIDFKKILPYCAIAVLSLVVLHMMFIAFVF